MFPKEPVLLHGGCNCGAVRYTVAIPEWGTRPANPYREAGSQVEGDPRIPMTVIDHCNDCRRATGALIPMAIVTDISWVTAVCTTRSTPKQTREFPAERLFDFETVHELDVFLTFYKSSPKRSRWFCTRCGTQMAYTIDEGVIPLEWGWPKMLDIWLGTIDRADLEPEYMAPERQLWCEKGVPWIRRLTTYGAGGVPEHPTTKINQVIKASRGIDEMLEAARAHLHRITPKEALGELGAGSEHESAVLVDIRPQAQRKAEGMIQGVLVIERNVLEWRFDPRCEARLPIASFDLRIIVFCQEGYTSSLAARALQELGILKATDMVGGYRAWKEAGLPDSIQQE